MNEHAAELAPGVVRGQARSAEELARAMRASYGPTAEQRRIIEAPTAPVLVVAGAGSGKTETLSMRIVYLLDHAERLFGAPVSPDEILCLTFTRKAAAEIAERADHRVHEVWDRNVDGTLGPRDPQRPAPTVSTYNGYASRLAAEHGLRVGVDPDSTVLTNAALWQLAHRTLEEWTASLEVDSAPSTLTRDIPALAAQLRDHAVTPAQLREFATQALAYAESLPRRVGDEVPGTMTKTLAGRISQLRSLAAMADLVEDFQERKRAGAYLDFADQVATAVDLADIDAVARSERAKYKAVLLDEFQDTSPGQLQLFARMFGPGHPVMAVGDPHQAIYGFRGASSQALADFVRDFGGDAVTTTSLSVSWRNESPVLAAANAAAAPLREHGAVQVPMLQSATDALATVAPTRAAPGVEAHIALTAADEADHIARFIADRRRELGHGRWYTDKGGRAVRRVVTAAVLCRKRSSFGAVIERLHAEGIAYEVVGLGGLLDTAEVADLVALLEVAHDPSRGDSLMRLLTSERVNLGPRDLAALHDWAEVLAGPRNAREGGAAIVDALAELPAPGWRSVADRALTDVARARLTSLQGVVASIRQHAYLPLTELVTYAERAWQLDIEAAVSGDDGRKRRNVDAFVDSARTFVQGAEHATLGAFLAWLDVAREHESGLDAPVKEPEKDAVQILTVHAAKGLEWDIVAVPGMVDGTFPTVKRSATAGGDFVDSGWLAGGAALPWDLRMDRDRLPQWRWRDAADHASLASTIDDFRRAAGAHALDEERRLFYVALTRARTHVLLVGSWFGAAIKPRDVSVFVTELVDAGLVSDSGWAPRPDPDDRAPEVEPVPARWPRAASPGALVRRQLAALVEERAREIEPPVEWVSERLPLGREIEAMLAERTQPVAREVALPAHLSTSALVAMGRDRDRFVRQLRRPVPQEPTFAAHRGSALHAWIETQYGHTPLFGSDDLGPDEEREIDIGRLKETFAASEWASRTPSDIEVDVELPLGGVTIRSRIDAVFPAGAGLDRVTVVDWKSGSPPRDAHERAAREIQLAVYRLAWSQWKGIPLDQVDAAFYYVAADATVWPERLRDRDELESLILGEPAGGGAP